MKQSYGQFLSVIRKERCLCFLFGFCVFAAAFVDGAFSTFHEGKIAFPPTYKFAIGSSIYDMKYVSKLKERNYWKFRQFSERIFGRRSIIHIQKARNHQCRVTAMLFTKITIMFQRNRIGSRTILT